MADDRVLPQLQVPLAGGPKSLISLCVALTETNNQNVTHFDRYRRIEPGNVREWYKRKGGTLQSEFHAFIPQQFALNSI